MERDLQDVKEEIRARSDIVEIIGQYTRLKRSGKNWTGLCPFHADKKPSFNVSPDLGIYKCFSCGEAGDLFKFVQKKENLDFVEALEWLARRAGIPFERRGVSPERASEREQMLELNALAVQFFQDRLTKSQEARDYLADRAILKSTQEQWDIGFAPPDWEALTFHLQQKRANLELAAKIGLIKTRKQEGSGYYDAFRHRLMFPIHDLNGRVIAFGGRAMSKDEPAKYLNSEQSALFDKSRTLYGLHFARKKLSGDTPAVFVEGYMDVITTHQAGFTQCVATLGTSMTEEHARLLVKYNPRVVICYDGDNAGVKATLRGATVWEAIGVEGAEVRVARLPAGDDPDSLVKRGETDVFQAALDQAIPRVEFEIELSLQRHDLQTPQGRDNALAELIPILASVGSNSVRGRYADRFAYLHPLNGRFGIERAIQQILADVETYRQQAIRAGQGRDRGYPLSEAANDAPLAESPPPATYRPPAANDWGQWPHTENVTRRGQNNGDGSANRNYGNGNGGGYNNGGASQSGYGKNGGYGNGDRSGNGYGKSGSGNNNGGGSGWNGKRRFEKGPTGDPTPPPLVAPLLTGAEKAERQLLRALFSPQWRVFLLSRVKPHDLVTPQGRQLFAWIARTPANEEGGIDPIRLLSQAETDLRNQVQTDPIHLPPLETDPARQIGPDGSAEFDAFAPPVPAFSPPDARELDPNAQEGKHFAKISEFVGEILEESAFLVSNDHLNEAAVLDCIHRLQQHREDQAQRELRELMQRIETLPPDQRRACIEQYQQSMRARKGSPPGVEDG